MKTNEIKVCGITDLSIANFMYVIRKRIKITPNKSIYLFIPV